MASIDAIEISLNKTMVEEINRLRSENKELKERVKELEQDLYEDETTILYQWSCHPHASMDVEMITYKRGWIWDKAQQGFVDREGELHKW